MLICRVGGHCNVLRKKENAQHGIITQNSITIILLYHVSSSEAFKRNALTAFFIQNVNLSLRLKVPFRASWQTAGGSGRGRNVMHLYKTVAVKFNIETNSYRFAVCRCRPPSAVAHAAAVCAVCREARNRFLTYLITKPTDL